MRPSREMSDAPPRASATSELVPPMSRVMSSRRPERSPRRAPAQRARGGAAQQRGDGSRDSAARGGGTATRLQDEERRPNAAVAERGVEPVEVAVDDGPHVGVERGDARAFVLAEYRIDLGRDGDREARELARDDLGRAAFVGRIAKREEVADRDRLDPFLLDQARHRRMHPRLVEGHDDGAVGTNPLGDPRPAAPGSEEHRCFGGHEEVVHARALLPADLEHILEPFRHQQTDARALLFEDRVGGDGGAVHEALDVSRRRAAQREHRLHTGQDAGTEVVRRRGHLRGPDPIPPPADHVGERASDVDTDPQSVQCFGHIRSTEPRPSVMAPGGFIVSAPCAPT